MIINISDLQKLRESTVGKIVMVTGTFDLFHYEHLEFLKDAKQLGDYLVVVVKDDYCASKKGAERPIIGDNQRIAIVDSIKYVDFSLLTFLDVDFHYLADGELNREEDLWLRMFDKIFRRLKPNIFYFEYNPSLQLARDYVLNKYNIEGVSRTRTERISTSKIIDIVIKKFCTT